MLKENSQKKLELNYQIIDPCYGQEGDKEEGMLRTTSRTSRVRIGGMMVVGTEKGRLKEAVKNEDKIIKSNMKTMSARKTRRTMRINIIITKIITGSSKLANV